MPTFPSYISNYSSYLDLTSVKCIPELHRHSVVSMVVPSECPFGLFFSGVVSFIVSSHVLSLCVQGGIHGEEQTPTGTAE